MKKISYFGLGLALFGTTVADAAYSNKKFQAEVLEGLDYIGARATIDETPIVAPGELGREVYEITGAVETEEIQMYIPSTMYVRMGAGLNLGFATDKAKFEGREYESSGSYTTQIGLGWNLSSYVRTEIDFQTMTLKFSDLDNRQANYQSVGGMLYFDLARRYVQTGDVTRRRTFVPFLGVGAGVGAYEFEGTSGANGIAIIAPRAVLGANIMLTDLLGIDIAYQYQMMIGDGFGWNVRDGGVDNISNIMATIRFNF